MMHVVDAAAEERRELRVDVVEVERLDAAVVAVVGDVDGEDRSRATLSATNSTSSGPNVIGPTDLIAGVPTCRP